MRLSTVSSGVMSLFLFVCAAAQEAPDLSGVWRMDLSRSESAHQATPIGPVTLIITQNPNGFTIETRKANARKSSREKLTYKLDGSAISTADTSGGEIKAKAHWDGPKLVTETARNIQGSTVTTMSVFSLDAAGNELTVDKSLTVQHGYQFEGAANTGTARDIFTRVKK